jgi:LysM repeat protein
MRGLFLACLLVIANPVEAQVSDSIVRLLKMDTSFAYLQYNNQALIQSLDRQLKNADSDKFVIFHYGGSHIQGEMPPTVARRFLQNSYGNGGRGMLFSYGAADTYSSVNYTSTKTGEWSYGKSFQGNPKVPLGVCGMGVESAMSGATLDFKFKDTIPARSYLFRVFTDSSELNFDFEVIINGNVRFQKDQFQHIGNGVYEIPLTSAILTIQLVTQKNKPEQLRFRFYGMDIETATNSGIVYHSLGVGAAAFRSVLQLDELEAHAAILKPDMVILDFGTNDILYTNEVDVNFPITVEKAIRKFRAINPEILILLTSTQDLYRKGKHITAGVTFVKVVDSIARANDCFFWNWYDLAGGYGTITHWRDLKYAKTDGIHLTNQGYEVKGNWIFKSFENTLSYYEATHSSSLSIPQKTIDLDKISPSQTDSTASNNPTHPIHHVAAPKVYIVKKGDTLSQIAQKQHTTVAKIKKANGLKSDSIAVGQKLKIPKN